MTLNDFLEKIMYISLQITLGQVLFNYLFFLSGVGGEKIKGDLYKNWKITDFLLDNIYFLLAAYLIIIIKICNKNMKLNKKKCYLWKINSKNMVCMTYKCKICQLRVL